MAEITEKTLSKIDAEYSKWAELLNGGIGLMSFSFGLSCLGTDRPDFTGFLSLVFVLIFAIYGKEHFPKKLKQLRKKELSGIDEVTLLGLEKKYFGVQALFRYFPIYLIGWIFLGCVTMYGVAENAGWL
jgi:hypothetical protein